MWPTVHSFLRNRRKSWTNPLKFYSTKDPSNGVSFREALFQGLAPDGGLYMPEAIPDLGSDYFWSVEDYHELAVSMIHPFAGNEISLSELGSIAETAFSFPVPLRPLDSENSILELFHGPTLAFKDFAARFMARTMSHFLEKGNATLTILVATSGDTGSAVANGFFGVDGVRVVILYPSKRVSPIQEKQLTTLGVNITALEIDGTFDDCQRLVKSAFRDGDLGSRMALSSANSINVARLLPQSVYYPWAWKQNNENMPVIFSVPSGNFGNLTGGLLAKSMGLPVEKFIAATNENDVFPTYLKSGEVIPREAVPTLSNAMDVGVPSNLERIQNLYAEDISAIRRDIFSGSFSDEATRSAIQTTRGENEYVIDPHTAVGILGLQEYRNETGSETKGIVLSTAHPGKFIDVVEPILGEKIPLPEKLKLAEAKEKQSILMTNRFKDFKEFLWVF